MANILKNPIVHGAITGIISAAVVDYHSFSRWKTLDDAKQYDWGTALLRWTQGAIAGALTAAGLGAM